MKRIWGIRHARYWWWSWQLYRWVRIWAEAGIGLGVPHEADIEYLEMIRRGEA